MLFPLASLRWHTSKGLWLGHFKWLVRIKLSSHILISTHLSQCSVSDALHHAWSYDKRNGPRGADATEGPVTAQPHCSHAQLLHAAPVDMFLFDIMPKSFLLQQLAALPLCHFLWMGSYFYNKWLLSNVLRSPQASDFWYSSAMRMPKRTQWKTFELKWMQCWRAVQIIWKR